MPITPPDHIPNPPQVGQFYANRATGQLVEIMDVHAFGDTMVLDVAAPLDADWQPLTLAQISSSFWSRVDAYATAA